MVSPQTSVHFFLLPKNKYLTFFFKYDSPILHNFRNLKWLCVVTWIHVLRVLNVLPVFRLALLRVHSHGLVTIDLQCYQEDSIAEVDNVGNWNKSFAILICYTRQKDNMSWKLLEAIVLVLLMQPTLIIFYYWIIFVSQQLLNALEKKLEALLNGNIKRIKR